MSELPLGVSFIEAYGLLWIVVPLLLVFFLFVVWALLVSVKWFLFREKLRIARKRAEQAKLRPDGVPYPPAGRGMCDTCEKAYDKVYYLPDGRRTCPTCYAATEMATTKTQEIPEGEKGSAHEREGESGKQGL